MISAGLPPFRRKSERIQAGIRVASGWLLISTLAAACLVGSSDGSVAEEAAPEHVAAKLTCGSHSANTKEYKPFQVELNFEVFGSLWMADRENPAQFGLEKFRGVLSRSGSMLIAGLGKSDRGTTWSYEFSGHKSSRGVTILNGSFQSEEPKGTRSCSLAF